MNLNWTKLIIHSYHILWCMWGKMRSIEQHRLDKKNHLWLTRLCFSVTTEHTLIFKLDPLCSHNWECSIPNPLKAQLAAKPAHLPWLLQHSTSSTRLLCQDLVQANQFLQEFPLPLQDTEWGGGCQRKKELHSEPPRAGCVSPEGAPAALSLLGCSQFSPG